MTSVQYILDLSFQEIDTNGFLVVFCKNPLAISLNHTGLPNSSISYHYHLDGHLHIFFQHLCSSGDSLAYSQVYQVCK